MYICLVLITMSVISMLMLCRYVYLFDVGDYVYSIYVYFMLVCMCVLCL